MEEQQDATQQLSTQSIEQRGELSPAVSYQLMARGEKAKYAAIAGVPSLILLEALHAGGPGLAIAGLIGYGAWHFSDRIRDAFPERKPDGQKQHRHLPEQVQSALYWLGTGQARPEASDEDALEDDEDEVQEAYVLNLGITLRPHPNYVFSNRVAILGMPGAGKSNTVAVLAEELGQYDAPFIIFDQKPEYTKLCAAPYFTNPFRANASNVGVIGAYEFGQKMMNERLQVVLDLTSYEDDDKAAYVMIEIIRSVLAWEKQFEVGDRLPVTFFFEEADYWLPQAEQHAHVDRSKEKGGKSLFNKLQQTVFNLVHRGRSFGMGTVISTQRPANIDNRAIAVAEWKILLKANMPSDLKVYQGFGLDPDAAQVLGKGEAYIIGPDIKGVFQIRKRHSPDEASTPGLENLQRKRVIREQIAHQPVATSPTSAQSDVSTSVATSERRSKLYIVNTPEVAQMQGRSGGEVGEVGEVAKITMTEREKEIASMFFGERRMNPGAIAKELTGGKGGDAYTKASMEVAEAIRKYVEVQQRGA